MQDWALSLGARMQWIHSRVRDTTDQMQRTLVEVAHAVRTLDPDAATHADLVETFVVDEGWAAERAVRVAERLGAVRAGDGLPALPAPVVLWMAPPTAFTAPGGRIYLSRTLVELLPTDGSVAFVVGHEMAHHDLGHLSLHPGLARLLGPVPVAERLALVGRQALHLWMRPEWELAADRGGAELCRRAGYPPCGAVDALRALERWALEHRAVEDVFGGPRDPNDPLSRLQEWWRQRRRGYVALRDRIEALGGGEASTV